MIVFLYGPDDYRRTAKRRAVVEEFVKKRSDIGLAEFDFESKTAPEEAERFLATQSLFDAPRLAVLENAFALEAKRLAKLLEPLLDAKDATVLVAEREKPVKALAFLLKKPVIVQEFKALVGAEWLAFVKKEANDRGADLAPSAVQFLGSVFQGDAWGLVTELEKIAALAFGRTAAIEKNDLGELGLETAPDYWMLMNGLKSHDLRNRLYAFESMLALADPPAKIFNILAAQWQEKTPHMAEYDLAVKSGKVDYEEALVDLLIS